MRILPVKSSLLAVLASVLAGCVTDSAVIMYEPIRFETRAPYDNAAAGQFIRVASATVAIRNPTGFTNGAAIAPDGYILSVAQGIDTVVPISIAGEAASATVIREDPVDNIAILKTAAKLPAYLPLRRQPVTKGEVLYAPDAAGAMIALQVTNPASAAAPRIQVTAAGFPPLGGPAVDGNGNMVGIVNHDAKDRNHIVVTPVSALLNYLRLQPITAAP